ncbi:helix-turn-helix transcriptional regulator [Desulfogranum japonicum]|uniref:helix-turn-helix transcriptional regulator n=1 Tax=Desulfogranum japonicum TaxID=231447 RepID=UPI00040D3FF6|nr:helix-turn-helix domain-containing protein [Desulfogranum japonicum]
MKTKRTRTKQVRRKRLQPIGLDSSNGASYIGVSEAMMRKMRSDGSGPPYKKIGRKVIYLRKDLQRWLENQ